MKGKNVWRKENQNTKRKKNCNCATIIHLVRAHTHGFIARFFSSIIFIHIFSRTFRFLFARAVSVFFAMVNKTRRKQSVNPIHELRNTCDRLTIIIIFFPLYNESTHSAQRVLLFMLFFSVQWNHFRCRCLVGRSFFFIQIFNIGWRSRFHNLTKLFIKIKKENNRGGKLFHRLHTLSVSVWMCVCVCDHVSGNVSIFRSHL